MKRAKQKFERDPRNFLFMSAKPYAVRKPKITNNVRDLISVTVLQPMLHYL